MRFHILPALALAVLGGELSAQLARTVQPVGPIKHARVSLATGEVTILGPVGSGAGAEGFGTALGTTTFANTDISGYYAQAAGDEEWYDWGYFEKEKLTGDPGWNEPSSTQILAEFDFAYATTVPDPAPSAGPVSVEIALFTDDDQVLATSGDCSGGAYGGSGKLDEVFRELIAGLPGDDDPGDGFAAGWIITIDVANPISQPPVRIGNDTEFGFSYVFPDPANNGPLLVTPPIVSVYGEYATLHPVGSFAYDVGTGVSNGFDVYAPGLGGAGTCQPGPQKFFDGGGLDLGIASLYLELREVTLQASSAELRDAVPPNPGLMVPESQPQAIIGASPFGPIQAPDVRFIVPNPEDTFLMSWSISFGEADLPLGSLGTVLISITPPNPVATVQGLYVSGLLETLSLGQIPDSATLVGREINTQGAYIETSGAFGFTNALDYVIGTKPWEGKSPW